jgi:hypothetical protein
MTMDNFKERNTSAGSPAHPGGWSLGRHGALRLALATLLTIPMLMVPTRTGAEENRRLRSGDPPEYSELAKKLKLRGVARGQEMEIRGRR